MAGEKNFIASLFDVSFNEFVTPKMIKFIYILVIVLSGVFTLVSLVTGLSAGRGLWIIIVAPIGFFISLIFTRMWLEMFMVFFRIMHKVEEIADGKKAPSASVPPSPPTPVA